MTAFTSVSVVAQCSACGCVVDQQLDDQKTAAALVKNLLVHGHFCPGPPDEFLDIPDRKPT